MKFEVDVYSALHKASQASTYQKTNKIKCVYIFIYLFSLYIFFYTLRPFIYSIYILSSRIIRLYLYTLYAYYILYSLFIYILYILFILSGSLSGIRKTPPQMSPCCPWEGRDAGQGQRCLGHVGIAFFGTMFFFVLMDKNKFVLIFFY